MKKGYYIALGFLVFLCLGAGTVYNYVIISDGGNSITVDGSVTAVDGGGSLTVDGTVNANILNTTAIPAKVNDQTITYTVVSNTVDSTTSTDPKIILPAPGAGDYLALDGGYIKCVDSNIGGVIEDTSGRDIYTFSALSNASGIRFPTWAGFSNSPFTGGANLAIQVNWDTAPTIGCDVVLYGKDMSP